LPLGADFFAVTPLSGARKEPDVRAGIRAVTRFLEAEVLQRGPRLDGCARSRCVSLWVS
jgi:hypothetical protein